MSGFDPINQDEAKARKAAGAVADAALTEIIFGASLETPEIEIEYLIYATAFTRFQSKIFGILLWTGLQN